MPRRNKNIRQNTVTGSPFDYQISVKLYKDSEHAVWKAEAAARQISLNEFIRITMRKECSAERPKEACGHMRILANDDPSGAPGASPVYVCKLCGERL